MADEFNYNNSSGNGSQGNGGEQNNGSQNYGGQTYGGQTYGGSSATGNGNYQYSGSNYGAGANGGSGYSGPGDGGNGGRKKRGGGILKALFAVVLAVIFGVCAGAGAYGISRVYGDRNEQKAAEGHETEAEAEAAGDGEETDDPSDNKADLRLVTGTQIDTAVTEVAGNVMPSIVSVYNTYTAQSQNFWGQIYSQESTSTGSGIIIANTGDELLIATNNHVVADADSLEVQFIDETTAAANLKGTDSSDDLAVIAVSIDDIDKDTLDQISVATLGSSDDLKIGAPVVAIGNALGYGQSVTTGVISALNRELTTEDGESGTFIQTDAAINPGNSGGALCDLNGNVIGINSNKIGGTTVEGMGYAIPMSKAEPIIERLASQDTKIAVDEDSKGYLGIAGVSVTSQVSSAYNMPQGAYVAEIYDGTGAADSDLQKGDIITAVNGSTVESMNDLQNELTYYAAGTEITLTVQRADGSGEYSEQEIQLTLSSADEMPSDEEAQNGQNGSGKPQQGGQNGDQNQDDNGAKGDEQAPAGNSSADEQDQHGGYGNGFYQFPWGGFFR